MWQTKYASAVPKNLGVGVNFRQCSEGYFLSGRPQSVGETDAKYCQIAFFDIVISSFFVLSPICLCKLIQIQMAMKLVEHPNNQLFVVAARYRQCLYYLGYVILHGWWKGQKSYLENPKPPIRVKLDHHDDALKKKMSLNQKKIPDVEFLELI